MANGDHRDPLLLDVQERSQEGPSSKTAAPADVAAGMPLLVTAAETRARAVYYMFTLLCLGLLVLLIAILIESHRWRTTIQTESQEWRNLMLKFEDDLGKHFSADSNPPL